MTEFSKILFIRLQEKQAGRVHYNGGLQRPERAELDDFIDILRTKYQCKNVTIIYINLDEDGWNDRGDILSVKTASLDWKQINTHYTIKNLFEKNDVLKKLALGAKKKEAA
jgi:hypothetical protein